MPCFLHHLSFIAIQWSLMRQSLTGCSTENLRNHGCIFADGKSRCCIGSLHSEFFSSSSWFSSGWWLLIFNKLLVILDTFLVRSTISSRFHFFSIFRELRERCFNPLSDDFLMYFSVSLILMFLYFSLLLMECCFDGLDF